ncbi:hypothetical protein F2P79_018802 [Pimephales promelas]|nr:hypothetical protein F2P79_018802 [Pimephales promelas]
MTVLLKSIRKKDMDILDDIVVNYGVLADNTATSPNWLELEQEACQPNSIDAILLAPYTIEKSLYNSNVMIHSTVYDEPHTVFLYEWSDPYRIQKGFLCAENLCQTRHIQHEEEEEKEKEVCVSVSRAQLHVGTVKPEYTSQQQVKSDIQKIRSKEENVHGLFTSPYAVSSRIIVRLLESSRGMPLVTLSTSVLKTTLHYLLLAKQSRPAILRVHTIPHGDALFTQSSTPGARAPRDVTCPLFLLCAWAELAEWLGTRCNSPFVIHEERKLCGGVKYSRTANTIELDNLDRLSAFLIVTSLLMDDIITQQPSCPSVRRWWTGPVSVYVRSSSFLNDLEEFIRLACVETGLPDRVRGGMAWPTLSSSPTVLCTRSEKYDHMASPQHCLELGLTHIPLCCRDFQWAVYVKDSGTSTRACQTDP